MNKINNDEKHLKIIECEKDSKQYRNSIIKGLLVGAVAIISSIRNYINSDSNAFEIVVLISSVIYTIVNYKKKRDIDEKIMILKKGL